MRAAPIVHALLLILGVLGMAACGAASPPSSGEVSSRWTSDGLNRYHAVDLPRVTQARRGRRWERGLVVNFLGRGQVLSGRHGWDVYPGWSQESDRRAYLEALRRRVGGDSAPVVLHADACERWARLADVLRMMAPDPTLTRQLVIPVRVAAEESCGQWAATLSPLADHSDAPMSLDLAVRSVGERELEVRLRVEDVESVVRHPVSDEFAGRLLPEPPERRSELAIAAMRDAAARVRQLAPTRRIAVVRLAPRPGRVCWGHVAGVLDLVLGAGLREVHFPGCGARLVFEDPEDLTVPPALPPGDPRVTPGILLASLLVLGLAFGATLLPLRTRR